MIRFKRDAHRSSEDTSILFEDEVEVRFTRPRRYERADFSVPLGYTRGRPDHVRRDRRVG